MQVAVVLVAIPVNLCAHNVVLRLMFVAHAITIHQSHIVASHHAILADLLALKNAGMIVAANVIAEELATNTSLFCKT
jgi:hypothetical protein